MATVIPVDEFITDEWYPGFKPGYTHAPWYIDPVQTFRKEDEENFWFLDFHWPRGLTPMGLIWNEDGYNWSSQLAAEQMPLPPGRGITCRLGGTHTYGSPLPVTDVREIGQRARRLERVLPPFLQNFDEIWGHMREEVNESWDYFHGLDLSALSLADLRENLIQARQYHKRAFEIHFQVMYPLLANYVGFYSMCTELGLDPGQIGKFLQGYDTKIMETDRELWKLTSAARAAGLESGLRRPRGRRATRRAGRPRRRGRHLADPVRRLPPGLRLAHRRVLRHRAAELDRGPDPGPRDDQDVPAEGHRPRLRGGQERGRRGARGGRRRRQVHPHPGGAEALRRRPGLLPGGELPVVAGRPQLLHRPAHLAADAVGLPGHRGPGRRRPPGRHALPVLGRDPGRLGRPPALRRRAAQPGRAAQAVLRLLAAPAAHPAQGGRHHPGVGQRPDPDRDLRAEQPLPAGGGGGQLRRRRSRR